MTCFYHGFGWDKVDFLHRGSYDAVLWIFDENSGDSTSLIFFQNYIPSSLC